jgi:hypothetical protein
MKNTTSAIYSIQPGDSAGKLDIKKVWADSTGELAEGYTSMFPLSLNGTEYLAAYNKAAHQANVYTILAGDRWLTPASAKIEPGGPWDILQPFIIGNQPHILAYESQGGKFGFFPVNNDLSLSPPYTYSHNYPPGTTANYTTVVPITYRNAVYYVCYNTEDGQVAFYHLFVTATSSPDSAPLSTENVYLHKWAKGWTRFAFFQLGGENFFLKTNTWKPNVNIDHIVDDPSQGSHPVGTHLNLEDAQSLNIVQPFTMANGNPYFVTYRNDGKTTFNRINGDCRSWVQEAAITMTKDAGILVPFRLGTDNYLLVY